VKIKRRAMGILVLSILLLVLIAIPLKSYTTRLMYKIDNYLPNNLYVDYIHLGGKTLEQANDELNKLEKEQLKRPITIEYDDGNGNHQSNSFTYEQIGYYIEKTDILEQLNAIMDKNMGIFKRFLSYTNIEKSGVVLRLSYDIHHDKYLKALEIFDNSKLKLPVDAKYSIKNRTVQITKEEDGYDFDKDKLYKELLENRNLDTYKLSVKAIKPTITTELLETQGVKELISSFTTKFDAGNVPRASNIRLAASIIDGTLLPSGGTFSFNEVVGKRTEERGFREAGVYINGKVDTGIGGGICQVSTTLYNAALLSDLQVIERSNHSLTVPYVPLSRDAAVSWGSQDLKFINNTQNHIYIHTSTTRGSITFELYSTKMNKRVELVSTTLSRNKAPVQYINDTTAYVGRESVVDKGHDGFQSQLIKIVYVDDKKVSSELVSKDKYIPAIKIIKRGTKMPDMFLDFEDDI
jgi:vancomycin resistance protein YoaR